MAVLVEGYSVIILAQEIEDKWPGDWTQFKNDVPNRTLCSDCKLVRVGFMNFEDALEYCRALEKNGILEANDAHDGGYVIVDQMQGPKTKAKWLEFGYADIGTEKRVGTCRLLGDITTVTYTPEGWVYTGSLSDKPNYVSDEEAKQRLERIRRRDGLEIYYDKKTRKQVFVGRTGEDKKK